MIAELRTMQGNGDVRVEARCVIKEKEGLQMKKEMPACPWKRR